MSIFSQPLSSEMGPPPSASHPSSCWIKTGLEQLFSPIIYLKALHCISYRAISAPGCLGTAAHDTYQTVTSTFAVHLIIFKMQLICLYSLTVCHTERRGTSKKDEENIFLRIIHLFYFFFFSASRRILKACIFRAQNPWNYRELLVCAQHLCKEATSSAGPPWATFTYTY